MVTLLLNGEIAEGLPEGTLKAKVVQSIASRSALGHDECP